MSFKKWIRIVFPEIQLIDFMKEHKAAARMRSSANLSSTNRGQDDSPPSTVTHSSTSLPGTAPLGPNSASPVREVLADVKRGVKQIGIDQSPLELDDKFADIIRELNERIWAQHSYIEQLAAAFKKAFFANEKGKVKNVILISGPAGTGKKTSLGLLIQLLNKKNLTSYKRYYEFDLSRYSEVDVKSNFIVDCSATFQDGMGTVCFTGMKNAHSEVLNYISQLISTGSFRTPEGTQVNAGDYFIIFEMDQWVKEKHVYTALPAVIASQIPPVILKSIRSYAISAPLNVETVERLVQQKFTRAASTLAYQTQLNISYEENVFHRLAEIFVESKRYGQAIDEWSQKEFVDRILDLRSKGELQANEQVTIRCVDQEIVVAASTQSFVLKRMSIIKEETLEDIMLELDRLTGLRQVKDFIHELLETVNAQKKREQAGQKNTAMSLHMVFSGNPGTGKTTVARLVSRILKALGLLGQGQLIEVTRQDLVGEYIGSTAPKTSAQIEAALGGVLFIDEAYTLARSRNDIFGLEAIDTLVKGMEDNRENMVVVLAGYTNEMETFLKANPGLRSRFPFIVEFPDYTPDDMLEIMERTALSRDYQIDPSAGPRMLELFKTKQIPGRNDSGNGRLVRNLLEEAIRKQSVRLSKQEQAAAVDWKLLVLEDFGLGQKEAFNIETALVGIIGLDNVKTFIRTLEKQIIVNHRRQEAGIIVDTNQSLNMVFSGNPGTGKTTIARLIAQMMKSMGILKMGHLVEVDRSHLVAEYMGQTATKTKELVESALGGVLFIDEAYALAEEGIKGGGFGKEAVDTLVRLIELHKDNLIVILAGYTAEMRSFLKINPGLSSRFPLMIEFPDYTAEQLEQITLKMAESRGFTIETDIREGLMAYYEKKQIPGKNDSGNGRLARNTLEEAIRNQSIRIADQPDLPVHQLNLLNKADFNIIPASDKRENHNALHELEEVIGLIEVKDFVKGISAQIEMGNRRKAMGLPVEGTQTLHMIFKGNPGTGKTKIARIIAKRLKELGAVKSDSVVETDRSGLVAGYLGQTALKTKDVIDQALGGVLFIDEAYSLASGQDDFGKEAIDTLVKAMDDYRDRLVVILAGYEQDMDDFIASNAGLKSRFPNIISFPDYAPEEMLQISRLIFKSKGYQAAAGADTALLGLFLQYIGDPTAGNGRLVRNICEKAIRNHAVRLSGNPMATVEELSTIIYEDVGRL
ncbi:AAA family ATPase [Paenibacillus periandrae]|uniref:AAA family ATPase n=1 Tax=Paenibacillus periandrae TaxID=1761741 RepID=UPI001F095175|nr:AAA family ATPase [Paenibacillus periandrae]